jgi:hypothetical protein
MSDADALDGSGCTAVTLTNNSSTTNADFSTFINNKTDLTFGPTGTITTGTSNGDEGPTANTIYVSGSFGGGDTPHTGELLNPVQAVLEDGSSMITGLVGNENRKPEPNSNLPCTNVGGVGGS